MHIDSTFPPCHLIINEMCPARSDSDVTKPPTVYAAGLALIPDTSRHPRAVHHEDNSLLGRVARRRGSRCGEELDCLRAGKWMDVVHL